MARCKSIVLFIFISFGITQEALCESKSPILQLRLTTKSIRPKAKNLTHKKKEKEAQPSIYTKIKNALIGFIKKHPFITTALVITLISKKMQKILRKLPHDILHDSKEHPLAMIILSGFILSYLF